MDYLLDLNSENLTLCLTSPPQKTGAIKGIFCISLDFEKFWGVHDVCELQAAVHINQVNQVVDKILQLFNRYETHATWATVGLLGHDSIAGLKELNADRVIPYENKAFSPFPLTTEKYGDFNPNLLLGQSEIENIRNTPFQEIGSHTYSHFYTEEIGVSITDFEADCKAMDQLGEKLKLHFLSLVLPRNQVNKTFIPVAKNHGIECFRGNQENRFWRNSAYEQESFFKKAGRVIDAYLKISKTQRYQPHELAFVEGVLNIPANRFFRPYSGYAFLEKRKIKRIKREMLKAAKAGTIYHLWWHPHNFCVETKKCLDQLEELLAYSIVLRNRHQFTSMNMGEINHNVRN